MNAKEIAQWQVDLNRVIEERYGYFQAIALCEIALQLAILNEREEERTHAEVTA